MKRVYQSSNLAHIYMCRMKYLGVNLDGRVHTT